MLNFLQSVLEPVMVELLVLLFGGLLAFALRNLPEAVRSYIERQYLGSEAARREALHSAAKTAAGLVWAALRADAKVTSLDALITEGARYVDKSVPDAIKALTPAPGVVKDLIRSKLQEQINNLLGRDPLADALNEALKQEVR